MKLLIFRKLEWGLLKVAAFFQGLVTRCLKIANVCIKIRTGQRGGAA